MPGLEVPRLRGTRHRQQGGSSFFLLEYSSYYNIIWRRGSHSDGEVASWQRRNAPLDAAGHLGGERGHRRGSHLRGHGPMALPRRRLPVANGVVYGHEGGVQQGICPGVQSSPRRAGSECRRLDGVQEVMRTLPEGRGSRRSLRMRSSVPLFLLSFRKRPLRSKRWSRRV